MDACLLSYSNRLEEEIVNKFINNRNANNFHQIAIKIKVKINQHRQYFDVNIHHFLVINIK